MNEHAAGNPTRAEAEALLAWACDLNPGPWAEHSRVVARAAEVIATQCGLEADKAYALGLLHDIGRYEGVRGLHHTIAGYALLRDKGYADAARICLTHSFPYQDIAAFSGGGVDCTDEELSVIGQTIEHTVYDEYDALIQLCDGMGAATGVCLMDVRLLDVARRHGVNEFTTRKWAAFFALKERFDRMCGVNIYELFREEIIASLL